MAKERGMRAVLLGLVLALGWQSYAQAQACSDELRALQAFRQRLRAEVIAGNARSAAALASQWKYELPSGYDFDGEITCQKWLIEVANLDRASCSFERARERLESVHTEQALAIDRVRTALGALARSSRAPFTCKDKKQLYLLCQPVSDSAPDAWCARPVEHDDLLEFPRDAWCKLVDEHGVELSSVDEGVAPVCREELAQQQRDERDRVRAARRASVATAGTGIAVLAAVAIPVSFVPQGVARLLRRLGAIDHDRYEQYRHRSYRARLRVLPLLGVNALALSSLSSRFWWAGVLTAGCGVTADVMLAQHWREHDKLRRGIGIATASLGAVAGLLLNLETMGRSDPNTRYALLPTLSVGVAQAELGLAGQF